MKIAFRQHVELGKRLLPVRLAPSPRRPDWESIQEFDFQTSNDPQRYAAALDDLLRTLGVEPMASPTASPAAPVPLPSADTAVPARPLSATERLAQEAHTAYGREHWSDVLDKTEILVERGAMTPTLWRERASAAFAMGDNNGGLAVVKQALNAGVDDADTLLLYVRLTARVGDDKQAAEILTRAYALASLNDTATRLAILDELVPTLARLGRWDEFARRVNDARRIAPDDPRLILRSVEMLLAVGRFDEAISASNHIPSSINVQPLLPVWRTAIATAVQAENWPLRHELLEAVRTAGADSNTIARWRLDFPHFILMTTLSDHPSAVRAVAWAPDGTRLAIAYGDHRLGEHTVYIWDASTNRTLITFPISGVQSVSWSPNGGRLAEAHGSHIVNVWEASTGRILLTLANDEHEGKIHAVAWAPDSLRLATAGHDQTARVWDTITGQSLVTINGAPPPLAWAPDGTRIATASGALTASSGVNVWEASTGRLLATFADDKRSFVRAVAWAPDSLRLATAGDDQTARIWDTITGRLLCTFTGHRGVILAIAWTSDGTKLATASHDWTARIWDATSGGPLATLTGHSGTVYDVAWSPDGMRLATASEDKTVKVWHAE